MRVVVRQFPGEDAAREPAARAAIAAHAQGKFWELHEKMIQRDAPIDVGVIRTLAQEAGLDADRLERDMASEAAKAILGEDVGVADKLRGTQAPPFLFVNGRWLATNPPAEELAALLAEETTKAEAFAKEKGTAPAELYETMRKDWRGAKNVDTVPIGPPGDAAGKSGAVPTSAVGRDGGSRRNGCVHARQQGREGDDRRVHGLRLPGVRPLGEGARAGAREVRRRRGAAVPPPAVPSRKTPEKAHLAALAAGRQGKFWEMHDLLFQSRSARSDAALAKLATRVGLDVAAFATDMADPVLAARIEEDAAACTSLGMQALPAFSINGTVLKGGQSAANFSAAIDAALAS